MWGYCCIDAISRGNIQEDLPFSCSEENDPFFPFVPYHKREITFPNGCTLQQLFQANIISLQKESDTSHDADTETPIG